MHDLHTPRHAQASHTRDLFVWLNQIKSDSETPAGAFKVAFEIGQYLNRQSGEAWPSTERIAKGIAMSQATVIAMVRRLEARGHLAIESGSQGRGHSHHYRMILKPQATEVIPPEKHQPAVVSEIENLNPLRENLSPLISKHQPADMNHLIEPSKEPSEDRLSPPPELFIDAPVETPPASKLRPPDAVIDEAFARLWAIYPRHVAKPDARKVFAKAVNAGADPDAVIEGAARYANERAGQDPKFTAHPATWLRAERWLDEPTARTGGPPMIDEAGNVIAEPPRPPPRGKGTRPSYATMLYGGDDR